MTKTLLGCIRIPTKQFHDSRGYFQEIFKTSILEQYGISIKQGNLSVSKSGVVRGMHYQINKPQGKLIHVLDGTVLDVALDLRKNSPTYLQYESFLLSQDSDHAIYIPPGFAHGFWVLSSSATFHYLCTEEYSASDERGINPLDPRLDLPWSGRKDLIVSEKDQKLPNCLEIEDHF